MSLREIIGWGTRCTNAGEAERPSAGQVLLERLQRDLLGCPVSRVGNVQQTLREILGKVNCQWDGFVLGTSTWRRHDAARFALPSWCQGYIRVAAGSSPQK
jgi:hypothetical protein